MILTLSDTSLTMGVGTCEAVIPDEIELEAAIEIGVIALVAEDLFDLNFVVFFFISVLDSFFSKPWFKWFCDTMESEEDALEELALGTPEVAVEDGALDLRLLLLLLLMLFEPEVSEAWLDSGAIWLISLSN